jgi:site-specific DNA recombinase
VRDGDGLASQETRCREYASYKGYDVTSVFRDDMTGGVAKRPAMDAMLSHLRAHRRDNTIVIIDDISRLARGLEADLKLRASLAAAGGKLESPSIEFGEDSDSLLVENLLASVAQHQREKNGEQTVNRMRARLMNGYWVFPPPVGYKFERVAGHGKLLVRDEPVATIVTKALEGYACGHLSTRVELKRFLDQQPEFPKDRNGMVHQQRITELLSRPIYAGYICQENWGLNLVPSKHEPLIDFRTWQAIQERREGRAKAPTRKDINQDFPLRGFVTCGDCDEPLTACWSKGRTQAYPYYLCDTKGCISYRKSIRKEKIEGEFEELLRTITPSRNVLDMADAMFRDLWDSKRADVGGAAEQLRRELRRTEQQVGQFLDRIVETDSPTLIGAYETRIRELETKKTALKEKIAKSGKPLMPFEETYRTAMEFLSSP